MNLAIELNGLNPCPFLRQSLNCVAQATPELRTPILAPTLTARIALRPRVAWNSPWFCLGVLSAGMAGVHGRTHTPDSKGSQMILYFRHLQKESSTLEWAACVAPSHSLSTDGTEVTQLWQEPPTF